MQRPDDLPLISRSSIFVDASAWVAASDRRDRHHLAARSLLEECFARETRLITTNWTAYEALSMLKSRAGWELASDIWALFSQSAAVTIVRVTEDYEQRAMDLFFAYHDKTWGVVDCASLIVMQDLGCRHAFGFDHHFVEASRQRGFEVVPSDA